MKNIKKINKVKKWKQKTFEPNKRRDDVFQFLFFIFLFLCSIHFPSGFFFFSRHKILFGCHMEDAWLTEYPIWCVRKAILYHRMHMCLIKISKECKFYFGFIIISEKRRNKNKSPSLEYNFFYKNKKSNLGGLIIPTHKKKSRAFSLCLW